MLTVFSSFVANKAIDDGGSEISVICEQAEAHDRQ